MEESTKTMNKDELTNYNNHQILQKVPNCETHIVCYDRYYTLVLLGPPTPYIARRQRVSLLHNTVMQYGNMYPVCFICIFRRKYLIM